MNRRTYLAAIGSAGAVATAGCGALGRDRTLSEPTVREESAGRRALIFAQDGEEVGHFGAHGRVDSGLIDLSTEIWHREGTTVESVTLRVWMPETAEATPSDVAVVSPVEGDSSPPPALALYTPDRALGTTIEITDLDDLADETISTLDLIVRPGSETATTLVFDATIELADGGILGSEYTLDGDLELEFPALADR